MLADPRSGGRSTVPTVYLGARMRSESHFTYMIDINLTIEFTLAAMIIRGTQSPRASAGAPGAEQGPEPVTAPAPCPGGRGVRPLPCGGSRTLGPAIRARLHVGQPRAQRCARIWLRRWSG